jgi:hypothetical protein
MNYTLMTAGRTTHLKVVAVSLIASIVISFGVIAARPSLPDISTQLEARAPVLKAGKSVTWSSSEKITVR